MITQAPDAIIHFRASLFPAAFNAYISKPIPFPFVIVGIGFSSSMNSGEIITARLTVTANTTATTDWTLIGQHIVHPSSPDVWIVIPLGGFYFPHYYPVYTAKMRLHVVLSADEIYSPRMVSVFFHIRALE